MKLDAAIGAFTRHQAAERGLSEHTVLAASRDLADFLCYLSAGATERLAVDEIAPLHIKDYVAHLRDDRQLKPRSIGRMLSSIRGLFGYSVQQGWTPSNPASGIRNPRTPRSIPFFLSPPEIRALLTLPDCQDPGSPEAVFLCRRDWTMLVTFLFTGVRLSELTGLELPDVRMDERLLVVRGKGAKERLAPLHETAATTLNQYLAHRGQVVPKQSAALFCRPGGEPLTRRMAGYVVEKAVRRAGISRRTTPHKLRHTFATQLLRHGASLMEIRELLGHADISTTAIYTHTNVDRLRRAVDEVDAEL